MRPTTNVVAQFDSVGYPDKAMQFDGTVNELMKAVAVWLNQTTMGSHMRITVARDSESLSKVLSKPIRTQTDEDIMGDFDAFLATLPPSAPDDDSGLVKA